MSNLIALALSQFKPEDSFQTERIENFFGKLERGDEVLYGTTLPTAESSSPLIPSRWIEWVCTDREAAPQVSHRGIRIRGAYIDGEVNLSYAKISFPLRFENCRFNGVINVGFVEGKSISLPGSSTRSIDARGMKLEGGFLMNNGFHACGLILLNGADIKGPLDFSRCYIEYAEDESPTLQRWRESNDRRYAVSADSAKVGQFAFFRGGSRILGAGISLYHASIGGDLDMSGATIQCYATLHPDSTSPRDQESIYAPQLNVNGACFLSGREENGELKTSFCSTGRINLDDAKISGFLNLYGSSLTATPKRTDVSRDVAVAMTARNLQVSGDLYLNRSQVVGLMSLAGGRIGGSLEVHHSTFAPLKPPALASESKKSAAEDSGHEPVLNCDSLHVAGRLRFAHSKFEGKVILFAAEVGKALNWTSIQEPHLTGLDLRRADVALFVDDPLSRPLRLDLDGFVYDDIRLDPPRQMEGEQPSEGRESLPLAEDVAIRQSWLAHADAHSLEVRPHQQPIQPYEQLASVYRRHGREKDARTILRRKEEILSQKRGFFLRGLYMLCGYGFSLWPILLTSLGMMLFCGVVFEYAAQNSLMKFAKTKINGSDEFPQFQSLAFSVDVFLPISLGLDSSWMPDPYQGAVLIPHVPVPGKSYAISSGGLVLAMYWGEVIAGWILTALFVVSVTSIFKK